MNSKLNSILIIFLFAFLSCKDSEPTAPPITQINELAITTIGPSGGLMAADLPVVKLGPENDFSFRAGPVADAALQIRGGRGYETALSLGGRGEAPRFRWNCAMKI